MWCFASDYNSPQISGIRRRAFAPQSITRMCCKFPELLLRCDEEIWRLKLVASRVFSLILKLPYLIEIAVSTYASYLQHFPRDLALRAAWINSFWERFSYFKLCLNALTSNTRAMLNERPRDNGWRNTRYHDNCHSNKPFFSLKS